LEFIDFSLRTLPNLPPAFRANRTKPRNSIPNFPFTTLPISFRGATKCWPYLRVALSRSFALGQTKGRLSRLAGVCADRLQPNAISNAIGYAKFYNRSHDAVIRVYDEAGNVIETHEHKGDFRE
jgi:hypothetical protein